MNQAQRKFLIDRIEKKVEQKIRELTDTKPEQPPNIENYLYGLALTGKLKLRPQEHILEVVSSMALRHNSDGWSSSWLGGSRGNFAMSQKIVLPVKEVFEIPKEYTDLWDEYKAANAAIDAQITALNQECETLTTRIQLASDKTLERLIAEVDDMGDISLVDNTLKSLIAPAERKLLE